MDGDQARLAELRATDAENATVEIDVVAIEADDLSRAHPCHRKEPDQGCVGPRTQALPCPEALGSLHQAGDLVLRVDVRGLAVAALRKQAERGNLCSRIGRAPVSREQANHAQAYRPLCPRSTSRLQRPLEREFRCDVARPLTLEEGHEVGE